LNKILKEKDELLKDFSKDIEIMIENLMIYFT